MRNLVLILAVVLAAFGCASIKHTTKNKVTVDSTVTRTITEKVDTVVKIKPDTLTGLVELKPNVLQTIKSGTQTIKLMYLPETKQVKVVAVSTPKDVTVYIDRKVVEKVQYKRKEKNIEKEVKRPIGFSWWWIILVILIILYILRRTILKGFVL